MSERMNRRGELRDVPIERMRTREEVSQRKLDHRWVAQIAQKFDIEDFGFPVVNHAGEWYWILDGQHRIAAFKYWLGSWQGQQVQCFVYQGLSEQEEAKLFDRLNTTKSVSIFDKFRVRLTAGLPDETNVEAIVRLNQLKLSRQRESGSLSCVGTLLRVYRRSDDCLNRTLKVSYTAFEDGGLEADIIDGIGTLVGRYDGQIEDGRLVACLKDLRGGATTLRQHAERLRQQMGGTKSHAIAAAAVRAYNKGRGGKKLPNWYSAEVE